MKTYLLKEVDKKIVILTIGICLIGFLIIVEKSVGLSFPNLLNIDWPNITIVPPGSDPEDPSEIEQIEIKGIKKFTSEQEFKEYIEKTAEETQYFGFRDVDIMMLETSAKMPTPPGIGGGEEPERVSETNVQVVGIDEPDIVKTDGKEIYFSSKDYWNWREPIVIEIEDIGIDMIMPPKYENKTKAIKAFPPVDLKIDSEINETGNMLLNNNILIIFSGQRIYGYDVSDPKSPQEKWDIELENNNYLVSARLFQEKIYLITRNIINEIRPCPISPLKLGVNLPEIKCIDIYHPTIPTPSDSTFIVMKLNPESGDIEDTVSFVGSSNSSIAYMSENAIYITYSYYESIVKFYSDFLKEKCADIIPFLVINKIEKLESYDISQRVKFTEFGIILDEYFNSLDNDEELRINNEITNRLSDYQKQHQRDLEKTGIAKIGLSEFDISANGNVPGYILNQFSLDEYQGHLRIAVTIGETSRWMGGWGISQAQSANDIYVLNQNLEITGSIKDLGLTERIYSARFIQDKGYIVTFRQIDPFYVLDLSNPNNPELKGELKIPGYSSYLHPISNNQILGIGKEDWQVKISLFDVSSAENPKELDKYILDESWSDVLSTHHAFLLDSKHNIFFMPGSRGGYVFSYKNNKLELIKVISDISAKRAIYLDDYLYVIGDNKIVVLNEIDWKEVNKLEF
ncbi:MAG: beta-propeller domain-containing protein [Candidatus Pacebacteria bacterium]|nr:beta-propeller domain-containing protein [Candidatus Paceibacterota bacterium]